MKHIYLLLIGLVLSISSFAQLQVSFTSSSAGGYFAPAHILAVWVEDTDGNYVKTLMKFADERQNYLENWKTAVNSADDDNYDVDAVTGATKYEHKEYSCSWDAIDFNGNLVENTEFVLCLELTDKNDEGNYSRIPFTIDFANPVTNNSVTEDSFEDIDIRWTPLSSISSNRNFTKVNIYPNPATDYINIKYSQDVNDDILFSIYDVLGNQIYQSISTQNTRVDVSSFKAGEYFIVFPEDEGLRVNVKTFLKR